VPLSSARFVLGILMRLMTRAGSGVREALRKPMGISPRQRHEGGRTSGAAAWPGRRPTPRVVVRSSCLNRNEKKKGDRMEEFPLPRSRPEEEKKCSMAIPVRKNGK